MEQNYFWILLTSNSNVSKLASAPSVSQWLVLVIIGEKAIVSIGMYFDYFIDQLSASLLILFHNDENNVLAAEKNVFC